MPAHNRWLIAAAVADGAAALLHLGCIAFGAPWYRFLGAGEHMARMAEAGHWSPTLITLAISGVLLVWMLYALSGAGVLRRLPLLRTALAAITAVLLLRGFGFVLLLDRFPGNSATFWLVSSAICVGMGLLHLLGLRQLWRRGAAA